MTFWKVVKWGSWRHVYHWFRDGCSRIDPEQKSSIASCTYGLMTTSSCMIRVCAIDQAKGWVILGRSQMLSDTQEGKGGEISWHWLGMKSARVTVQQVLRIRHAVCPLEKPHSSSKFVKTPQTTQMKSMKWCWVYWLLKAILILTGWDSLITTRTGVANGMMPYTHSNRYTVILQSGLHHRWYYACMYGVSGYGLSQVSTVLCKPM